MATATSIPDTDERVPRHTSDAINALLHRETLKRLERFDGADAVAIDARIAELRREWDIERTLEANAATVALVGLGLGTFVDRRWLALPAIVAGFLLQHAVQGWCPPVPVFRRLGVRTAAMWCQMPFCSDGDLTGLLPPPGSNVTHASPTWRTILKPDIGRHENFLVNSTSSCRANT